MIYLIRNGTLTLTAAVFVKIVFSPLFVHRFFSLTKSGIVGEVPTFAARRRRLATN